METNMEQTQELMESDNKKLMKYTFDGKGKEAAVEKLNQFALECNKKDFGKKVSFSDIIAFALLKLNDGDIKKIQDQSMSKMDILKKKFREASNGEAGEEDFAEWLLMNLKVKGLQ